MCSLCLCTGLPKDVLTLLCIFLAASPPIHEATLKTAFELSAPSEGKGLDFVLQEALDQICQFFPQGRALSAKHLRAVFHFSFKEWLKPLLGNAALERGNALLAGQCCLAIASSSPGNQFYSAKGGFRKAELLQQLVDAQLLEESEAVTLKSVRRLQRVRQLSRVNCEHCIVLTNYLDRAALPESDITAKLLLKLVGPKLVTEALEQQGTSHEVANLLLKAILVGLRCAVSMFGSAALAGGGACWGVLLLVVHAWLFNCYATCSHP